MRSRGHLTRIIHEGVMIGLCVACIETFFG